MNTAYYILIIWNVLVFAAYGLDKRKAIKGKWRVKEGTLIALAFLMGGLGSLLGMVVFRHKIRSLKFKILVPLALVINILIILGGISWLHH